MMGQLESLDISDRYLGTEDEAAIKKSVHDLFWSYFNSREGDIVFSKWFIKVRMRDLRFVFETLVGPE